MITFQTKPHETESKCYISILNFKHYQQKNKHTMPQKPISKDLCNTTGLRPFSWLHPPLRIKQLLTHKVNIVQLISTETQNNSCSVKHYFIRELCYKCALKKKKKINFYPSTNMNLQQIRHLFDIPLVGNEQIPRFQRFNLVLFFKENFLHNKLTFRIRYKNLNWKCSNAQHMIYMAEYRL